MSRRHFLQSGALAAGGVLLAACQPQVVERTVQSTVEVEVPVEVEVEVEREVAVTATPVRDVSNNPNAATGVPYEIKSAINDGEPINLTFWEYHPPRADYETKWCQEYQAIYPNVSIEMTQIPWADYYTKLITNIPAGQGPTFYKMHMNYLTPFCEGGLMDPMPPHVADQAHLTAHWAGFEAGLFNCPGSDDRYFVPMGAQLPVLYINRTLWEEAGLTDADIPTSWDQLHEVAKALTKTDGAGRIVQAGFQPDSTRFAWSGLYQQGRYLFTGDRQHVQLNNDEGYNVFEFLRKVFIDDPVTDPEFPGIGEAFPSGQSAMVMSESFFVSTIRQNAPDLDWMAVLMPTFSGELPPAVGRMHFAVDVTINSQLSEKEREVAWDFWHFIYANDERLVHTISLGQGMLPAYDKLLEHPAVKADQHAAALPPGMEYAIPIGELPDLWTMTVQSMVLDPILLTGASIEESMQTAEAEINNLLGQKESWNILERNYKHDDLMIPNQP